MAAAAAYSLHLLPVLSGSQSLGSSAAISGVRLQRHVPALRCVTKPKASRSDGPRMNLEDDPILKQALKEPVAFLGGIFAGLLRLDLKEDPLREWVSKTTEAAGIKEDEETQPPEEGPEEITIE